MYCLKCRRKTDSANIVQTMTKNKNADKGYLQFVTLKSLVSLSNKTVSKEKDFLMV